MAPRKSGSLSARLFGRNSGRKSGVDAPDMAARMGHLDKMFLGADEEDEEEMLSSRFKEGTGAHAFF